MSPHKDLDFRSTLYVFLNIIAEKVFHTMKYKLILLLLTVSSLYACTHASISEIPEMINNKEVYTYQGRSNFAHQLSEADRKMKEHCKNVNGGSPVILSRNNESLGYVVSGNASTGINAMGNQNQVIKFICQDRAQ